MSNAVPLAYEGPECPRCHARLTADWIRSGIVVCPDCNRSFEATAFDPPQRQMRVVEVSQAGPDAASNACALHARNTAVTSCQRCGLFICSLCDMNVGTGSYCPSCFDKVRSEGSLKEATTRYRDFGGMARTSMIVGLLFSFMFLGLPFGVLTVVYSRKGFKQYRAEGRPTLGLRIIAIVGLLEAFAGAGLLIFIGLGIAGVLR